MANGGIIGPTNPVGAIARSNVSVITSTETITTGPSITKVDTVVIAGGGAGGGSPGPNGSGGS